MRFYPIEDPFFFIEISDGWDRYCRNPCLKWTYHPLQEVHTVQFWRDLEGAKKEEIRINDLYFENWMKSRINPAACLPLYYCVGNRFIRLERAFPAGFKCAPLPVSLVEAREIRAKIKEQQKLAKKKKGKGKKKKQ